MSKSLNCSVKKVIKANFGTFAAKVFALHTCNMTGKDSEVFVMTIFACTEIQTTCDLVKVV